MAAASASSLAGARLRTMVLTWKVAAVGGVVTFAAYALFGAGFDHFFNRYWYNALILLARGVGRRPRGHDAVERSAWIAFAVGSPPGRLGSSSSTLPTRADPPYPSVADAFYLLFYPACYVGLMLLVRTGSPSSARCVWFDGAMAAIAAAALGAAVLFEVVLRQHRRQHRR